VPVPAQTFQKPPPPAEPRRPTPVPQRRPQSWPRRIVKWLLRAFALFLIVPPIQCALLNVIDPPVTETMLNRAMITGLDGDGWRMPAQTTVSLRSLPRWVPQAAVSSEDRGFFGHHGFDWPAIRHAWKRYRTEPGAHLVGGSTISQQVARNVFVWQHRSWLRKGLEAWYTVWLELLVPKQRILEVYLNVAELGPMVFGIEAASQHWYHKPAAKLKPAEAAHLVALLPAPNTWTIATPHVQQRARWILASPVRYP
jgi:monofunctional biosynthetic peptidoglycan transglycosylase